MIWVHVHSLLFKIFGIAQIYQSPDQIFKQIFKWWILVPGCGKNYEISCQIFWCVLGFLCWLISVFKWMINCQGWTPQSTSFSRLHLTQGMYLVHVFIYAMNILLEPCLKIDIIATRCYSSSLRNTVILSVSPKLHLCFISFTDETVHDSQKWITSVVKKCFIGLLD